MKKKQTAITLGIMCCILTFCIVIQINTIKSINAEVGIRETENGLRDQVLEWKEKYDREYKNLQKTLKKLEKQRELASQNNSTATQMEEELKRANILLGVTDVRGTGVIVTVSDNQSVSADTISILDKISYYLVHDEDLRVLVNELKNAGAEAISINDQRIVNTTSITCNGNVVLINGEKVGSPFVIRAIGYSPSFTGALLRPGGYVETLNKTGLITTVEKSDEVYIPKYNGVLDSKNI